MKFESFVVEEKPNKRPLALEQAVNKFQDHEKILAEKVLDKMEKLGAIAYQDEIIIIDFEAVKKVSRSWDKVNQDEKQYSGGVRFFYKIIEDLDTISKKDFVQGNLTTRSLDESLQIIDHEKFKQKILDDLIATEILEKKDELLLLDLDKFKKWRFHNAKIGVHAKDGKAITNSLANIYELLSGLKVISTDDYGKAKAEWNKPIAKNIFFSPRSLDHALDPNRFKTDKDYYLDVQDMNKYAGVRNHNINFDIKCLNGEEINANELDVFTTLYRDLKARRNERGDLEIMDPKTGQYKIVTTDFFYNNIRSNHLIKTGNFHRYFLEKYKNLENKDLLRYRDLVNTSQRKAYNLKESPGKKDVSFDSVKYFLSNSEKMVIKGKRYEKKIWR